MFVTEGVTSPATWSFDVGFAIPTPTRPLKSVIPSVPLCLLLTVLYISEVSVAPNEPGFPVGSFTENPTLPPGVLLFKLASPSVPPLDQNPPALFLVLNINGVPFI